MPRVLQGVSKDTTAGWSQNVSTNSFFPLSMNYGDNTFLVESEFAVTCRVPGTLARMDVRIILNTTTLATTTVVVRKNGGNGNISVSIAPGASGTFTDFVNSDVLVDGDTFNGSLSVSAGGGGSIRPSMIGVTFTGLNNHAQYLGTTNNPGTALFSSASTTRYATLIGKITATPSSPTSVSINFTTAGTLQKGIVIIPSNGRTTDSTIGINKNGSAGNISMAITAGATGTFEDTSNSDSVVSTDDIAFFVTNGSGAGSLEITYLGVCFLNLLAPQTLFGSASNSGTGRTASATPTIYPCVGTNVANAGTLSDYQISAGVDQTTSQLQISVSSNTYTADATLTLQIGGADGNQLVTITAATTGLFSDGVNTDVLVATDDINYSIVGGTSGTLNFIWITNMGGVTYSPFSKTYQIS